MKTSFVIVISLAAFITGGIGGFWLEHHRSARIIVRNSYESFFWQAKDADDELRDWRHGDTNKVIELMQTRIDAGVFALNLYIEKNQHSPEAIDYQDFLQKIARNRDKYPWHSGDTNWDKDVAAALAKITK
jgi:hypothetical protein